MSQEYPLDEDEFITSQGIEPDPQAEDKAYEKESQEKLDNKLENTARNLKMHECFNCGTSFSRAESLEAETPEEYAETYCSDSCMKDDLEQMEADKAE